MKNLLFEWAEQSPLVAEISKPIRQVSFAFASHGRPVLATVWRPDGTDLRLHSQMHDVAERREVGVLNFEKVSAARPDETIADLASAFQGAILASRLIIHESGTRAESGVVLKASNGNEIIIVAGAYSYSLAVLGVLSLPHIFEPEYPLDRYTRVPFTLDRPA